MKFIISIGTLLISLSLYAGECSKQTPKDNISPIEYMDETDDFNFDDFQIKYKQYTKALNTSLQNSSDLKIQLLALSYNDDKNLNIDSYKNVLKQAMSLSSDKYTLFLADRLCHNKSKLTSWCHNKNIHSIHYQIDPENLITYLFNIHKNDKTDKKEDILILAADNSTHADSFFFEYTIEYTKKIDAFNKTNPELFAEYININEINKQKHIQETNDEIKNLQLLEKGIIAKGSLQNSIESVSFIMVTGFEMAQTLSLRELFVVCKNDGIAESCRQIAKSLINSKEMMNNMIGASLMTQSQELLGVDENIIQKTKQAREQKLNTYSCFASSPNTMFAITMNKKFIKEYLLNAKKFGELEAYKKLAFDVYNIEKRNGFNPEFNPNNCE